MTPDPEYLAKTPGLESESLDIESPPILQKASHADATGGLGEPLTGIVATHEVVEGRDSGSTARQFLPPLVLILIAVLATLAIRLTPEHREVATAAEPSATTVLPVTPAPAATPVPAQPTAVPATPPAKLERPSVATPEPEKTPKVAKPEKAPDLPGAANNAADDIAKEAERKRAEVERLEKIKRDQAEELRKNPPPVRPFARRGMPMVPPDEIRKLMEAQQKAHREMFDRMIRQQREFQREAMGGMFERFDRDMARMDEMMKKQMEAMPQIQGRPGQNGTIIRQFRGPGNSGIIIQWRQSN